ncbi:MAG: gamma-glutamyltransferase family protein [Geminicoccaceae bacterium]|nr:gamma-glutamyltransferase family protein [Geminicoccaceae bacterium]
MRDFQLPGRSAAYGAQGMAATSHPEATRTALAVLEGGGNAVDAAVAASALLGVVEPAMTGFGGDLFCLVGEAGGEVTALASAGWAPEGASVDACRALGIEEIAQGSPHAVTVPGYVAGIEALLGRHGSRTLDELLRPAIRAAEEGFVVTPRVACDWATAEAHLNANAAARAAYLPGGRAPREGERHELPALARTLRRIAGLGGRDVYAGGIAEAMLETLRGLGGVHTAADFADFRPRWETPIRGRFRGFEIVECPPPGQGVVALLMMQVLDALDLDGLDPSGAERYHLEAEATRIAFALRDRHLADPDHAALPLARILSPAFAAECAGMIDPGRAAAKVDPPLLAPHPDTVYLTVVDRDRTVCSFICSLFDGFGSGLACPETGILFHSRGKAFRLDPGHPNTLVPRKRPMHTIIPGLALKDGEPSIGFGVMGAHYQPVGQAHVLTNMLVYGMDPQAALDHPRAMGYPDGLQVERGVRPGVVEALAGMGHAVRPADGPLGGGQVIRIDRANGVLVGGTDPRKDGVALGH